MKKVFNGFSIAFNFLSVDYCIPIYLHGNDRVNDIRGSNKYSIVIHPKFIQM